MLQEVLALYSPRIREKLSEKSRTLLQRSLTGHRSDTCRPVLAFVYRPNLRSKRCSYPFSDSFSRKPGMRKKRTEANVPTLSVGSSCLLRLRDYLFSYYFWLAP